MYTELTFLEPSLSGEGLLFARSETYGKVSPGLVESTPLYVRSVYTIVPSSLGSLSSKNVSFLVSRPKAIPTSPPVIVNTSGFDILKSKVVMVLSFALYASTNAGAIPPSV